MNKTKSVIQVVIKIDTAESVQDLKDLIQSNVGDVDIVKYSASKNMVVLYIAVDPLLAKVLHTVELEDDGKIYSTIHVVESIIDLGYKEYKGSVQEVFAQKPITHYAKVIHSPNDPLLETLLEREFNLKDISTYGSSLSITLSDEEIVVIDIAANIFVNYSTRNKDTGTIRLSRYEPKINEEEKWSEIVENVIQFDNIFQGSNNILDPYGLKVLEDSPQISDSTKVYVITSNEEQKIICNNETNKFTQISIPADAFILEHLEDEIKNLNIHNNPFTYGISKDRVYFYFLPTELLDGIEPIECTAKELAATIYGIRDFYSDYGLSERTKTVNSLKDILSTIDDIENDRPLVKTKIEEEKYFKNDHELNVDAMKDLLSGLSNIGADFETMAEAVKMDVKNSSISITSTGDLTLSTAGDMTVTSAVSSSDEELKVINIADTITEEVQVKVALISFNKFDQYASKHNIIGWSLSSPTTLLIKYMDGVTSEEKIKQFHDMMDMEGWAYNTMDNSEFLSDFHKTLDRDLVQEFLARVKKHNIFVRESTAKMRSALLDMEKDFEELKDEVNLTIDWEELTAFASRKERVEHRVNGVETVFAGKNRHEANVVRVDSSVLGKDFYIPFDLINDVIREKYVLDDEFLYIENVPDYAFYEVHVNGHVLLIEKTDL